QAKRIVITKSSHDKIGSSRANTGGHIDSTATDTGIIPVVTAGTGVVVVMRARVANKQTTNLAAGKSKTAVIRREVRRRRSLQEGEGTATIDRTRAIDDNVIKVRF